MHVALLLLIYVLSSYRILQLPSVATLKSYVHSNKEAPAESASRIAHERSFYDARLEEHVKTGKPNPPLREDSLIADEVKSGS